MNELILTCLACHLLGLFLLAGIYVSLISIAKSLAVLAAVGDPENETRAIFGEPPLPPQKRVG